MVPSSVAAFFFILATIGVGECGNRQSSRSGSSGVGGAGGGPYSCKSPNGENVDWYVAYKLPQMAGAARGTSLNKGTAFLYADARNTQWDLSEQAIDHKESAIGATVNQLFAAKRNSQHLYALYNDEHPGGPTDSGRAHMKGMVVFDEHQGFWLVHSVPNFPSTKLGSYIYPDTGKRFGQSFLCITTSTSSLGEIGKQLFYSQPSWFEKHLPSSFADNYPQLAQSLAGKYPKGKAADQLSSVAQVRSLAGQTFTSFSKYKKWGKDLYEDLVAPQLGVSLYVETWLNGGGDLPSECQTPNKVYNLRTVKPSNYKFENSKDHSKWAVSGEGAAAWTCIGDINRQKSQEHRGGGTVCLGNENIATLYRRSMGDVESCGNSTQSRYAPGFNSADAGSMRRSSHRQRKKKVKKSRKKGKAGELEDGMISKAWKSLKKMVLPG